MFLPGLYDCVLFRISVSQSDYFPCLELTPENKPTRGVANPPSPSSPEPPIGSALNQDITPRHHGLHRDLWSFCPHPHPTGPTVEMRPAWNLSESHTSLWTTETPLPTNGQLSSWTSSLWLSPSTSSSSRRLMLLMFQHGLQPVLAKLWHIHTCLKKKKATI